MKRNQTVWIVSETSITDTCSTYATKEEAMESMIERSYQLLDDGYDLSEICIDLYKAQLDGEYVPEQSAIEMRKIKD